MLRISISSNGPSGLTFNSFEKNSIPKPPNGIDAEVNNDVLLLFDDEAQALAYADNLSEIIEDIDDDNSPGKLAVNDIIAGIYNNDFVIAYRDID